MTAGALVQRHTTHAVSTRGAGFHDITGAIARWLDDIGAGDGVMTALVRHTSASLVIQENADPDVRADLADALDRLAPEAAGYRHVIEGPDDMPAHIKSMVTAASIAIPVAGGKAMLGTWQALYLVEHRRSPHVREIVLSFIGELGSSLP